MPFDRESTIMRAQNSLYRGFVLPLFMGSIALDACVTAGEPKPPSVTLQLLERRKEQQIAAAKESQVFHDFQFTNRIGSSGIRFEHQIVDDAGKDYKAAHYDHGNGMAVADVDGDGWLDLYFTTQLGSNRLYRNLGRNQFEDLTATAGVGLMDQISVTASFITTRIRPANASSTKRRSISPKHPGAPWAQNSSISTRTGAWTCS
jgi:FG-GAP-like repeat